MYISIVDNYKEPRTIEVEKVYYDEFVKAMRLFCEDNIWKIPMSKSQFNKVIANVIDYIDTTDYIAEYQSNKEYEKELADSLNFTIRDELYGSCNYECFTCVVSHCCPKQSSNYDEYDYAYTTQAAVKATIYKIKSLPNFSCLYYNTVL